MGFVCFFSNEAKLRTAWGYSCVTLIIFLQLSLGALFTLQIFYKPIWSLSPCFIKNKNHLET